MRSTILKIMIVIALTSGLCVAAWSANAEKKLDKVVVGSSPVASSAGIFIAMERGYFAQEGIECDTTTFASSGAELLPMLVKGDLDVGAGNVNAGLYNAFNEGHRLQIVADKGNVTKGCCGYLALVASPARVPNGDISKFKIEKGFNMAVTAPGVSQEIATEKWAQKYGLQLSDVNLKYMPYAAFTAALANGSLDATVQLEPHVALAVKQGAGVRIAGDDEVYPNQQSAVILYSENFAKNKKDVAQRWMNAYLRGLRDYNDAFFHGKDYDAIVKILAKWTPVKDETLYKLMVPVGLSPDGALDMASLKYDADWLFKRGYVKKAVDVDKIVNTKWIEAAVKKLGLYVPAKDKQ